MHEFNVPKDMHLDLTLPRFASINLIESTPASRTILLERLGCFDTLGRGFIELVKLLDLLLLVDRIT